MAKFYISEEQLREIFDTQFDHDTDESFVEWVDKKMEEGEIELVEFNHYEVSKLNYKPVVNLTGVNGNIFNLMSIAKWELEYAGKEEKGKEMCDLIMSQAKNYDEALRIIIDYVEVN